MVAQYLVMTDKFARHLVMLCWMVSASGFPICRASQVSNGSELRKGNENEKAGHLDGCRAHPDIVRPVRLGGVSPSYVESGADRRSSTASQHGCVCLLAV